MWGVGFDVEPNLTDSYRDLVLRRSSTPPRGGAKRLVLPALQEPCSDLTPTNDSPLKLADHGRVPRPSSFVGQRIRHRHIADAVI